jgi:hypothetical protein
MQSAATNTAFAVPLTVSVQAARAGEPVAGGVVTFTAPDGNRHPTATLDGATLAANGQANVTAPVAADGTARAMATANGYVGTYRLTAATRGGGPFGLPFSLTNSNTAPAVTATGGPYTLLVGDTLNLAVTVTDPDLGQDLTGTWGLNGHAGSGLLSSAPSTGGAVPLGASRTWDQLAGLGITGPGTYTVTVTARDGAANSAVATTTLTVVATPPAGGPDGALTNNGPILAGQPATVTFFVPPASTAGVVHFSAALTRAGLADSYATAGAGNTATFTFPGVGRYTVYGRMFDDQNRFEDYTTTVQTYRPGAGDVRALLWGSTLVLTGDAAANSLVLDQPAAGLVRVGPGVLSATTINGQAGPVTFRGVTNLVANLNAGDDALVFDDGPGAFTLAGGISVNGGAGSSALDLHGVTAANLFLTALGGGDSVVNLTNVRTTVGGTQLLTGAGRDTVSIQDSTFNGAFVLATGAGDDTVAIQAAAGATRFHGLASVHLGTGANVLTLAPAADAAVDLFGPAWFLSAAPGRRGASPGLHAAGPAPVFVNLN